MKEVSIAEYDNMLHQTTDKLVNELRENIKKERDDSSSSQRYRLEDFRPIFRTFISKYLANHAVIARQEEFQLKWEDKNIQITAEFQQHILIMKVYGVVDNSTAPVLDNAIRESLLKEYYKIVLDHSELNHISSAGLSILFDFINKFRKKRGDIKLANVPDRIFKIYDLLGFTTIFKFFDSNEDAIKEFDN